MGKEKHNWGICYLCSRTIETYDEYIRVPTHHGGWDAHKKCVEDEKRELREKADKRERKEREEELE